MATIVENTITCMTCNTVIDALPVDPQSPTNGWLTLEPFLCMSGVGVIMRDIRSGWVFHECKEEHLGGN